MNNKIKTVKESETESVRLIRPVYLNPMNRLFGGALLQWIDEIAGLVAKRHCNGQVITAAIDNLQFLKSACQGEDVIQKACITWVGRTSMEVRVDSYKENLIGDRELINRAYVVMVAIDSDGIPVEVPRLRVVNQEERLEWEHGIRRNGLRIQRREEGF